MKAVLGVLIACVMLTGCEKRSTDGLSNAGAIRPLTNAAKPLVSRNDLTDALALQTALEGIAKRAPPVGDAASEKASQQFYNAERAKIAPSKADYLMPVTCGAQEGNPLNPLSYIRSVKNIVVRIYNGQSDQEAIANSAREKVSSIRHLNYLRLETEMISGHLITDVYPNIRQFSSSLQDHLSDLGIQSSSLTLPSGVTIMTDSPVGAAGIELEADVAESNYALAKEESQLLKIGRIDGEDVGASISKAWRVGSFILTEF